MTRHKDFSGGVKVTDFEPLTFSLAGERFEAKPAIQGSVLLEFVARADGDGGGAAATALYSFFEACMSETEYARLQTTLKNPDIIIDMELIGEVVSWLVEEYTARPTQPPSSSLAGHSTSGPQSTAAPSSQVPV